jgi:hypothetical protein
MMLKNDIEKLQAAMTEALIADARVSEALASIIGRLGYELTREVLGDFAIILETKNYVRRVRRDWSKHDVEG